jgi:hypothetical protein
MQRTAPIICTQQAPVAGGGGRLHGFVLQLVPTPLNTPFCWRHCASVAITQRGGAPVGVRQHAPG